MDKRLLTRFLMQLGNSPQDNPFPQVLHKTKYKLAVPSSEKLYDCTCSNSCLVRHLQDLLLWCCYTCNYWQTKALKLVAVLQAAPHQPLVTLLRLQGLSLLMRQFIMYAVAMADSDQESLITDQSAPPPSQLQPTQASSQLQPPVVARHASAAAPSDSASASIMSSTSPAAATAGLQPSLSSSAASPASAAPQSAPAAAAAAAEHQPTAEEPAAAASASTSGMMTVEQGVQALRQYLSSVGRHGPSSGAFLTPMYGCAELPQAFCRCTLTGCLVECTSSPCMLHQTT